MSEPAGRLRVQGGARLRSTLKAAGRQLDDLTALHKRVADLVAVRARVTAPVGPPAVHVRDTIRASGTKAAAIVRAGNNKRSRAGVGYAKSVHWGHQTRPDRNGAREVVRARPWISAAAQDLQPRWSELYLTELDRIIDTVEGTTTP
jgi:hypothetical protein